MNVRVHVGRKSKMKLTSIEINPTITELFMI